MAARAVRRGLACTQPDDCDVDMDDINLFRRPSPVAIPSPLVCRPARRRTKKQKAKQAQAKQVFADAYRLVSKIRDGGAGTVYKCQHRATGTLYAVKVLEVTCDQETREAFNEIRFLRSFDHANLLQAEECFQGQQGKQFLLVTHLADMELFDFISHSDKVRGVSEITARLVMRQVMSALEFMHARGAIHRDVKLENILVFDSAEDGTLNVKLGDFGYARQCPCRGTRCGRGPWHARPCGWHTRPCGSPYYMAPEVIQAARAHVKYHTECDIWSAGVVLYTLVAGYLPFQFTNPPNKLPWYDKVQHGTLEFHHKYWRGASAELLDLISCMLQHDPAKRPTARECLEHPWFASKLPAACSPSCALFAEPEDLDMTATTVNKDGDEGGAESKLAPADDDAEDDADDDADLESRASSAVHAWMSQA